MNKLIVFLLFSVPITVISRKSLSTAHSHGFYRFFAWEGILWLAVSNWRYWFTDLFSFRQIISWTLLVVAGYAVIAGIFVFKKTGKIDRTR